MVRPKLKFHKLKVEGMHGQATKTERSTTMQRFRAGELQLLLTTDLTARGLDVSSVGVVFNFDLPHDPQTYVHRVGRTGRMGKAGIAITLVTKAEAHVLDKLEKAIGITFERPVFRLGEVREKDSIDAKIERGKALAGVRKIKEKAADTGEKPKKKKKDKDLGPSAKQAAKGRAKKALRQAYGQWKKASRADESPAAVVAQAPASEPTTES